MSREWLRIFYNLDFYFGFIGFGFVADHYAHGKGFDWIIAVFSFLIVMRGIAKSLGVEDPDSKKESEDGVRNDDSKGVVGRKV